MDDLQFDWDQSNVRHIARHGVSPREVEEVLLNDPLELDYQVFDNEDRYVSSGASGIGRFLTVVWTVRGEMIRVVTAFDATTAEREAFLRQRD